MADEAPKPSGGGKNVGMAVLCYLGILVLIPLLTDAKNDPFVKFHIKQGIVLLIFDIIISVIIAIPVIGWVVGTIGWILVLILFIMGIVNAVGGQEKELPVIGKFGEKINI
ncbi:MAG: hypothetical protein OEV37_02500 [Candidatus Berkelbacteria bacterium]|nr:hypothetical protein [Candidatus Berkelbacteria bacterium]